MGAAFTVVRSCDDMDCCCDAVFWLSAEYCGLACCVVAVFEILRLRGCGYCVCTLVAYSALGFKETTDPLVCLSGDLETNECLDRNGGCWIDTKYNITACKDTFRGRVCKCPLVNDVQHHGDGYAACEGIDPNHNLDLSLGNSVTKDGEAREGYDQRSLLLLLEPDWRNNNRGIKLMSFDEQLRSNGASEQGGGDKTDAMKHLNNAHLTPFSLKFW